MCWVKSDRQLRRCVFCGMEKKGGNESSHGVKVGRRLYVWALGLPLITQNGILYAPFPGGRGGGCLQNRRPADDR